MSHARNSRSTLRPSATNRAKAGPTVEDHGRVVTANPQAAALYREAQQAVDLRHAVTALRLAIEADPTFGLAVADLDAMTAAPPSPISRRQMVWERHHVEVVRTAATGDLIEPPTFFVNSSPVLVATRSLCASSPISAIASESGRG